MADEPIRAVVGELMTVEHDVKPWRHEDIIDAEFETLSLGPSERLLPPQPAASIRTAAAPDRGLDTLRKSHVADAGRSASRGDPVFWSVGLCLVAAAFWVSGGHALVGPSILPAWHVSPANPLRIAEVTSRIEDHAGRAVLFVDGKALNSGSEQRSLPPIEVRVIGNDGHVASYGLNSLGDSLGPGATVSFSSRLEAPKDGVRSVSVKFQE
jgi:hypothetical protein